MSPGKIAELVDLCRDRKLVVLTGAGCSTDSGIPDYRGPETARRARNPIQFRDFAGRGAARRRYWARAMVGWPRFRAAQPNIAHRELARLERGGCVAGVITQNVDRLHQRAGSRRVVELHGALAEVRCLACQRLTHRDVVQAQLAERNPGFELDAPELAPDGDAMVADSATADFVVPECGSCGGVLKPNVVFFGEGVPQPVVAAAWSLFEDGEILLVLGSSLTVFSGFRFVRRAVRDGKPVAIANLTKSRGDALAQVSVHAPLAEVMPALTHALLGP